MNKPNIIVVMADQMRHGAMGRGDEEVITPNLDSFAAEGTLFSRAISNTPVCSPARASMITGLHTLSHELVNNDKALGTGFRTLGSCLNDEGYKCGYIGKWHMDCADRGVFVPPGPRRQGFDDFWASYNCNHRYYDAYYYLNDNPEPVWIDGYEPFEQTRIAGEYIKEKAAGEDPFCLFLSYGPPHCPYKEVPDRYKEMYPVSGIKLKPNTPEHADREIIQGYYAHITALDECFGRLLETIDEAGIREDSIVIFTSDHGDMLFSQDRGWKGKPWQESVNIPFIARWPGHIPADRTSSGLISLVDLMPTLLSITGTDIPDEVQGRDVSALLTGEEDTSQDSVFINYPISPKRFSFREWRGVVTKRYTYARFREKPWILYDDINDPDQLENLAQNRECTGLVKEMDSILNEWLDKLDDPFESSEEVASRYYQGSVDGTLPYYENEVIKTGKELHKRRRESISIK